MDRDETLDFHTRLLELRKQSQPDGDPMTLANVEQRDKEQNGENEKQQKYD
jgi:hypothetical protein